MQLIPLVILACLCAFSNQASPGESIGDKDILFSSKDLEKFFRSIQYGEEVAMLVPYLKSDLIGGSSKGSSRGKRSPIEYFYNNTMGHNAKERGKRNPHGYFYNNTKAHNAKEVGGWYFSSPHLGKKMIDAVN